MKELTLSFYIILKIPRDIIMKKKATKKVSCLESCLRHVKPGVSPKEQCSALTQRSHKDYICHHSVIHPTTLWWSGDVPLVFPPLLSLLPQPTLGVLVCVFECVHTACF